MRPALLALALEGAMILGIACGGSASAPPPEPSAVSTPQPSGLPAIASSTIVPPVPTLAVEGPCHDPYPGGAPFEPTPGLPVRLRPDGTPPAQTPYRFEAPDRDARLADVVRTVLGDEEEHFAVVIKNLEDGTGMSLDPERRFYAASLYKVWVMLEAFNQAAADLLDWQEQYIVSDYYESLGLNPGELQQCDVVTLLDVVERMMGSSDNVAANLLLERVGAGNVNRSLRSLGVMVSGFYNDNTLPATARETALLLEAIYQGAAVSQDASERMLELLATESLDDRIPALLPEGTEVAHKTGSWDDATHDAGIVVSPGAAYLLVVLTDYGFEDFGAVRIAQLSRAVYDHYNR